MDKWREEIDKEIENGLKTLRETVADIAIERETPRLPIVHIMIPWSYNMGWVNRHLPKILSEAGWPSQYEIENICYCCWGEKIVFLSFEKALVAERNALFHNKS